MRILVPALALALGACAASPPGPTMTPYAPPPRASAPRPADCARYAPLRNAIADARGKVNDGDQTELDRAARVASDACNPRNRAAKQKADKALRGIKDIRDPVAP